MQVSKKEKDPEEISLITRHKFLTLFSQVTNAFVIQQIRNNEEPKKVPDDDDDDINSEEKEDIDMDEKESEGDGI